MRLIMRRLLSILCVSLGLVGAPAHALDGILSAIPSDALGFAVVRNLADVSRGVDDLAKLVQAPRPGLFGLAQKMTGLEKGLDAQGDLALVLTRMDPEVQGVVLVPVANFEAFFAAIGVQEPATGVVEVQLAGAPRLVGRKGDYAALAWATDRDSLEQFLASTTSLATDASLASWLDANQASVVVTSRGVQQLLPKMATGIRAAQTQLRQAGGPQGEQAADALNLYLDLFEAAKTEVAQFGVALRIDSARDVDLVKRVQFTPGGACAKWAANAQPAHQDLLAGFPPGPFVMALGGAFPEGLTEHLMKFSVQMMQSQPQFKLTPEQGQKYAELSTGAMRGVQSMRMLLRLAEPGTGLYGNTSLILTVDDSRRFLDDYEKSLAAMRELAREAPSAGIPVATSQRIVLGETEALEVSMDFADLKQFAPPGGPDLQGMMQLMFGASGKLTVYAAPAGEHAVVMAYTSLERLKAALEFYRSKQPGLSRDADVAKVADALPPGARRRVRRTQRHRQSRTAIGGDAPRRTGNRDPRLSRESTTRDGHQGFARRRRGTLARHRRDVAGDRERGRQGSRRRRRGNRRQAGA